MRDNLYRDQRGPAAPFEFDQKVAAVFPDMIRRSVPAYPLIVSMITVIAGQYVRPHSRVYDLGCSLGEVSLSLRRGVAARDYRIIAVDNSEAMIERCLKRARAAQGAPEIEFRCEDLRQTPLLDASLIIMNFTLQFIPPSQRDALLKRIYAGLRPGGVFILSEKLRFADAFEEDTMQALHHRMKALNGYAELEIAAKREALEDVLIPEPLPTHRARLRASGFKSVLTWLRCLNFASLLAFK